MQKLSLISCSFSLSYVMFISVILFKYVDRLMSPAHVQTIFIAVVKNEVKSTFVFMQMHFSASQLY